MYFMFTGRRAYKFLGEWVGGGGGLIISDSIPVYGILVEEIYVGNLGE